MKFRNIILGVSLLTCFSCSDFLDEFSQTYIRASKVSDYDELLLGSVYVPSRKPVPPYSYVYPAGNSCDFFNMLDDDLNGVIMNALNSYGSDNYSTTQWLSMSKALFGYSTWQQDICNTKMTTHDDAATWEDLYQRIAILNTILEEIDDLSVSTDKEILDKERIKGECYFLRGQFYLILVNLYGKPYNPVTASTDLGVPLKLTSGVEHDNNKDTQFERTTLDKIYSQIVDDLKDSVNCLSVSSKGVLYRASKSAAILLLSRVYLYMQQWQDAKELLENNMSSFALSSLVGSDTLNVDNRFLTEENEELIFSQGSLFSQIIFSGYAPDFCVSHDLYNLYETNDMRRFFFTQNMDTDSLALSYKYMTGNFQSHVSDVLMLRGAEAYLNMAEACAMMRTEDGLANKYLNELRRKRINDYVDENYVGEELVSQIRNERRKELCFEGHRWFDLRRYTVSNPYPYTKKIYRVYGFYGGYPSYLLEQVETYVLEENDFAYTFDIPKTVKEFDVVPMPGNERPARVALEEM